MSIKRKKIAFFILFSFYIIFLLNFNIAYSQQQMTVEAPSKIDISTGNLDNFLRGFCHQEVAPTNVAFPGVVSNYFSNLINLILCLMYYIISLPLRFIYWVAVMFMWLLTYVIAAFASMLNNLFVIIIEVSLNVENLDPSKIVGIANLLNFTKAIGNGLVVLAGVLVGLATVLKIEEYSIRRHFGKLIALIVLVNYSHWIVIAATTTANEIAKPFLDALKYNNATLNIASNIWNRTQELSPSITIPYDKTERISLSLNQIPGAVSDYFFLRDSWFLKYFSANLMLTVALCIYLFLFFTIFLTLLFCFIYFSLYGFIRIFMVWILMILAPIAFSTIIFERSQVYKVLFPGFLKWDNWLQSVLTWSFLVVPMLFIFFFGDMLYFSISNSPISQSIVSAISNLTKEGISTGSEYLSNAINELLKILAQMAPVIILFIFYTVAFAEVKNQIKNMTASIVGNLTTGIIGAGATTAFLTGGVGLATGAFAAGTGTVSGFLASKGYLQTSAQIARIGQAPAKILRYAGSRGREWSEKAKEWAEKGETVGRKIGAASTSLAKKATVGRVTGGTAGGIAGGAAGALIGTSIAGIIAPPLAPLIGAAGLGFGVWGGGRLGSWAGKKAETGIRKRKVTSLNTFENYERKRSEELSKEADTNEGKERFRSLINSPETPMIDKLRMASVLQSKDQSDETQRTVRNLLSQFTREENPENVRNLTELYYIEKISNQLGEQLPEGLKQRKREMAKTTLEDKNSLPLEKAAALKALIELPDPLNQEEIRLLKENLPYFELDESTSQTLVNKLLNQGETNSVKKIFPYLNLNEQTALNVAMKIPSLAPVTGISREEIVHRMRNEGRIREILPSEIPYVYDLLTQEDKRDILQSGSTEQKAIMVELVLHELNPVLHYQYQIFTRGKNAEEKIRQIPEFLSKYQIHKLIDESINEKIAKIEDKIEKRRASNSWRRFINTLNEVSPTIIPRNQETSNQ